MLKIRSRILSVLGPLFFLLPTHIYAQTADILPKTCTVVDTDLALDDYRAISLVLAWRENVSFVVTEGVTDIPTSKVVLQAFLARAHLGADASVLVGRPLNKVIGTSDEWLIPVREHFNAIAREDRTYLVQRPFNGHLIEAKDESDDSHLQAEKVFVDSLNSCSSIEILLLGPATNFVRYAPLLRSRVSRVVAEMRLIPGKLVGFNCEYDHEPCMQLGFFAIQTRFEFASTPHGSIIPTCEFIHAFGHSTVGDALIRLHQMEPSWSNKSIQLWDDGTALYFLALVPFTQNADGMREPSAGVQPEWFRHIEEMSITHRADVQEPSTEPTCSLSPK